MALVFSRRMTCLLVNVYQKPLRKSRQFGTSLCYRNVNREARMLMKMLSSASERKMWNSKSQSIQAAVKVMDSKRATVLNKLYMTNVTQAMMCEEFGDLIGERGVEVTRVTIEANYRIVFVHWICKDSENPLEVQNILDGLSGIVRQRLIFSNVMGRVPEIRFKRDLKEEHLQSIIGILHQLKPSSSDKLEDFKEPTPMIAAPTCDIPGMRQDTLGLNHDRIMERIKKAKSKSYPLTIPPVPPQISDELIEIHNSEETEDIDRELKAEQYEKQKAMQKYVAQFKKSQIRCRMLDRDDRRIEQSYFQDDDTYERENN